MVLQVRTLLRVATRVPFFTIYTCHRHQAHCSLQEFVWLFVSGSVFIESNTVCKPPGSPFLFVMRRPEPDLLKVDPNGPSTPLKPHKRVRSRSHRSLAARNAALNHLPLLPSPKWDMHAVRHVL